MSASILSILVPTRNRPEYAQSCLRSLLRIPDAGLEIVVQDNSDDASLGEWLAREHSDARVRYAHVAAPMTVIENFGAALGQATGEYVAMIGDDDTVNPELLHAARWAHAHDVDALTPSPLAVYHWPDVRYKYYGDKYSGTCSVRPFTGAVVERDVEQGVRDAARVAFQGLVDAVTLPKVYYGMVRRDCFERLRRDTGTYFPGVSPDMAAAIGVSRYVRRLYSVDYPLFLPGTSAKSAAGASAQKKHVGRLEDQPHIGRDFERWWPATVPMLFLVQTVWAQSGVAALEATGRDDLLRREFDVALLHAACAVLNGGIWRETLTSYDRALRATGRSRVRGALDLTRGVAQVWGWRAKALAGRLRRERAGGEVRVYTGLATVEDAAAALQAHLDALGASIEQVLVA